MPLIHHVITGNAHPPIVFVHGFACAHTDWNQQVMHLSPRHQTVTVDLRGHGASPGAPAECSIERYGADVAEVMRALNLPKSVIVGHSMGCRVAVEAALQAPECAKAVVLVDGSQFAPVMGPVLQAAFVQPNGFSTVARALFEDMFTAKTDIDAARVVIERALRLPRAIGEKMLLDLQRYDQYRLTASLKCLQVPVMAIQATFSNDKRQRSTMKTGQTSPYLEMLRDAVPGIRVEVVPDTGHFPQFDEPKQTNALFDSFLASL